MPRLDTKPPPRERILASLKRGPLNSVQVVALLGISRSAAVRNLNKLRDDGLVSVSNAYNLEANEMRQTYALKEPNAPR